MMNSKKMSIFLILLFSLFGLTACSANAAEEKDKPAISDKEAVAYSSNTANTENISEYVSIIKISINPSLQVYLDEEKVVVRCEALNEDAEDVLASMENTEEEFDWFVLHLLDCCVDKGYLTDEGTIEVAVVEINETSNLKAEDIVKNTELRCNEVLEGRHLDCQVSILDATGDATEPIPLQNQEICSKCGGTGEIICDVCNGGEPVCDLCFGKGQIEEACHYCSGNKVYPCYRCRQTGMVPEQIIISTCGICNGKGIRWVTPRDNDVKPGANDRTDGGTSPDAGGYWDTCDLCYGKGTLEHRDPAGTCPNCSGAGQLACDACGQTGIEITACHRCGGTGKTEKCNRCGGRGTMKCDRCQTVE